MEKGEHVESRRRSARLILSKATSAVEIDEDDPPIVEKSHSKSADACQAPCRHDFTSSEILSFRQLLLDWYSLNKRQLPWRSAEINPNPNVRFYAVWVSEVMLQQTQVATVFDYYNKWMKRWPTLTELSKASLEDVNQLWSGLGYYSRAKRLLETAKLIETKLNGIAPQNAAALQKLPGIGQYTACAIASIAFNEVKGVVDGNVMRVLTRLRMVGADVSQRAGNEWLWQSVNRLVDPDRPGDFNQALMEFGATVCTPKNPSCSTCPLKSHCLAVKKFTATGQESDTSSKPKKRIISNKPEIGDIECVAECGLCIPRGEFRVSLGVLNYPQKGKKKAPREELVAVAIPYRKGLPPNDNFLEYFMVKRPEKGLLASLWEFPNAVVDGPKSHDNQTKALHDVMKIHFTNLSSKNCYNFKFQGEVLHIFSHIRCTYTVYTVEINKDIMGCDSHLTQWITSRDLQASAISTAMRKVFKVIKVPPELSLSGKILKVSKKRKHLDAF